MNEHCTEPYITECCEVCHEQFARCRGCNDVWPCAQYKETHSQKQIEKQDRWQYNVMQGN